MCFSLRFFPIQHFMAIITTENLEGLKSHMIQLSSSFNRICVDIERENISKETKIDKEELFIFTDQPEYNS